MSYTNRLTVNRRTVLKATLGAGALASLGLIPEMLRTRKAPAVIAQEGDAPQMPFGVASGDILADQAMLWAKTDRPARMHIEWATTDSFKNSHKIVGPAALENSDFTAKYNLDNLPTDQEIFYRISFQSLEDVTVIGEPAIGHLRTAPSGRRNISFLWSGDTAGQGWGINPDWGGMKIYKQMASLEPDFFIHSGDTIYADNPINNAEIELADGTVWHNVLTEGKAKVAETLAEFRGNFAYNLLDENVREFNAIVPSIVQWDDHEVVNNWYPNEMLISDDRYTVKSAALLAARGKQAFMEYCPIRSNGIDRERIFRTINYGPSLDVFVIDMRSYRADNGANSQTERSEETDFLGREQIRWLKQELLASNATWKVIASDMPIGLIVYDDFIAKDSFENLANGDGEPVGRELEMMDLLRFIKYNEINNVVWLTADVHYTAAHYYDPEKAQFTDFAPFYEFVSGPLNSGTFGPNGLDNTFGPQVLYAKAPEPGTFNLPPSAGLQFFGQVEIDGESELMTVTLRDLEGEALFVKEIEPVKDLDSHLIKF
ncbi:MAG: alkaline phosphatase D family protein [Chloroflexota bacterium]